MPGDFDLVKERVDIVQLVAEHGVQLRRSGRSYVGLCPFHTEKTPSFHVDPERRTYHCFGCSEAGDVFTFLEKKDGLTPSEALHTLAERAGVELVRRAPQERERETRLLAANETAHFYFRQALRGTQRGKEVAAYLRDERGITDQSVERFGLGYAPDLHDGLLGYLRKRGFSDEEAVASGLVVSTERGLFDRFRERLIVPIRDGTGRTIAFGGRALRADQPAKYVNSPQTILFNKSATLYALDVAKPAMRRASRAVIVEGYFDAIACHQAGIDDVVASMGTALTADQYRALEALRIERAVVAFDPDPAGTNAAEKRSRELLRELHRYRRGAISTGTGTRVYVAALPEGTGDPDVLARTDPSALRAILEQAEPVLDFVIDRAARRYDLGGADGRRRFLAEALPLLADEPDPLQRELYFGRLATLTGVAQERLREVASAPAAARAPETPREALPSGPHAKQVASTERYLMAQLLQFPEEAARIELAPGDLADPDHQAIFEFLRSGGRPTAPFPAHLAAAVAALGEVSPEPARAATDVGWDIERLAILVRKAALEKRLEGARAGMTRAANSGGDVGGFAGEIEQLGGELAVLMRELEQVTVLRHSDVED